MILRPMRPRFDLLTTYDEEEVLRRIRDASEGGSSIVRTHFAGNHFELMIDDSVRHYWSPRLAIEVHPIERGTRLHGLIGPHPAVWTFFAFLYCTLLFAALAGATLGMSQAMAQETAWGLWFLPAAFLVVVVMYSVSRVGQRLAKDQIHQIQDFLLAALL